MKKFEYKKVCEEEELNDLGEKGWEIITIIHLGADRFYFFLKREILEETEEPIKLEEIERDETAYEPKESNIMPLRRRNKT